MDNAKMGAIIREARKKKGLTQKDIAIYLNITDRAVSKWERGICAPDLALLEPLAEILEISITELITGELETVDEHKEELEHVVKETIQYSKQETTNKKKIYRKRILLSILGLLPLFAIVLLCLLHFGFFHKIGKYSSPDGTFYITVYDCNLNSNEFFPTDDGFTIKNNGAWRGGICYLNAKFRNLWWSYDGNYQVISMYCDNQTRLELTDYIRNTIVNLSLNLELLLHNNDFFSAVPFNTEENRLDINFEFIKWSEEDTAVMLLYFNYNDINGTPHKGYMWYDCESETISGEMEYMQTPVCLILSV